MQFQSSLEAKWYKRNEVVPEKVTRKSNWNRLHDTMQEKLGLKYDDYHMVSDERFNDYLYTIEHKNVWRRETHKRAQYKIKSSSGSNDASNAYSGIIPNKSRKNVKKTSQGEAISFSLCNRAKYKKTSLEYISQ